MLSAHKLGPKGVEYYVSYAGRGAEGYWLGKAAASLGLVGAVDPAAFRALAKGEHPDGGRLLERVATGHTPGWDITLSAPKSVSLAWALADEPLRAALAEAHRGAVKAAFSFLEDEGGRARRGFGGRDGHVPAGLAIACFVHPASRELDPQLHTHGIVCNVVEGSDGRWTALDSRMIYLHRRAAASIYRAELRERVAELGGQWLVPDRRGLSELEGFDREVLRSFSKRRNAIEAELERTGRSGPRASEAACLKTRRDKLDVELVELRDTWTQRARALGVTRESVTALLDGTDRRVAPTAAEVAVVHREFVGAAGLTRAQAAFTRDDVIVAWAERCTQGARRAELEGLADDTLADPAVVPLVVADETGRPLTTDRPRDSHTIVRLVRAPASGTATLTCALRYSTTEMLNTESRLLALGRAGFGKACGIADAMCLEAVLAERRDLSSEQVAMVRSLCSSGNGVEVVIGVPGSGKTFALDAARRAWQLSGYRVYGAALAAEAAAQLEAGSRISSVTLDRLVYELSAPQHLSQCALDSRSVVVVDEASMVDTRRLVRLLEIAERAGAKGVLPGRPLFSRASMPSSGLSHEPRGGCAPGAPYTRLKRQ
jgi:conjugative relaxase-like TrwC/TraI family protein